MCQSIRGQTRRTSGNNIGNADLKWAFSEAAVLFLRDHPAGQKYLTRLAKRHGKGKAFTRLAHKRARAVYYMLRRQKALICTCFSMSRERSG